MNRTLFLRSFTFVLLVFAVSLSAQQPSSAQRDQYPNVEKGIQLFKEGNAAEAFALFVKAKEKNPEISPPEVMLARLYYASKNVALGKNSLQSAVLKHPEDPEAWNILGDIHLQTGNWAEAELLFERGLRTAKTSRNATNRRMKNQLRFALNGLSKSYETRKVWIKAQVYLSEWSEFEPKNINVLRRLAVAQLNQGQVEQARASLNKVSQIDPQTLPPGVSISNYYQKIGELEKAKAEIVAAMAANQDSFVTQVAGARWAIAAGELGMAEGIARNLVDKNQESVVPTILMASIELFKGNHDGAENAFRLANQKSPGNFEAVVGLAMSLLKQDQELKLKQGLEHATVMVNSNKDIRQARGRQAYSILAWALFRNGQVQKADQVIQNLAKTGELGPDAAYFAAEIYHAMDKTDVARQLVESSLKSPSAFVFQKEARSFLQNLN